jgi:FOG: WD40-like repeat
MRVIRNSLAYATFLLAAGLLAACALPASQSYGSVAVSAAMPGIGESSDKNFGMVVSALGLPSKSTMYPTGLNLATIHYHASLSLAGASDSPHADANTTGSFSFASVSAGTWALSVEAYDASDSVLVGSVSSTIQVEPGASLSSSLSLAPPSGTGSFSLNLAWPSTAWPLELVTTMSPINPSGSDVALPAPTAGSTSASYASTSLSAGIYRLCCQLRTSSTSKWVWGTSEIVYIFPSRATAATLAATSLSSPPADFSAATAAWQYDSGSSSCTRAAISWYGAAGASSFKVERAQATTEGGLDSATYALIATMAEPTAVGYMDSGLDQSQYYRYRLTASNEYGRCANSKVLDLGAAWNYAMTVGQNIAKVDISFAKTPTTNDAWNLHPSDTGASIATYSYSATVGGSAIVPASATWLIDGVAPASITTGTASAGGTPPATYVTMDGATFSGQAGKTYTLCVEVFYKGYYYSESREVQVVSSVPGTLKWSTPYSVTGSTSMENIAPTIGVDGTIYAVLENYLCAITDGGGSFTQKWSSNYSTGSVAHCGAAVGRDGTVYVLSSAGTLYALTDSGGSYTAKWNLSLGSASKNSLTIGPDGTVYAGASSKLNAVSDLGSSGSIKWSYALGSSVYTRPAIGSDGSIYFGSNDTYFYALNPDGALKWRHCADASGTATGINSSPALASDGTIYFGGNNGYLYALRDDGTTAYRKWAYKTAGAFYYDSPAIGLDGTVYIGANDFYLYAVKSDGTLKWSYFTNGSNSWMENTPAIASDGTVYLCAGNGSSTGKVYALKDAGQSATLLWSTSLTGGLQYSSPAIGADGTVYVGAFYSGGSKGYIYALCGSAGPGTAQWPMYGRNPRHSGFTGDAK